jgi:trans-aconitate methyltransferase
VRDAQMRPLYEAVLEQVGLGHGTELLDAGCGAGLAAQLAAQRGAVVSGFDATPALLAIAAERVPNGEFTAATWSRCPTVMMRLTRSSALTRFSTRRARGWRSSRRAASPAPGLLS